MKIIRSVIALVVLLAHCTNSVLHAAPARINPTASPTAAAPGWNVTMVDNTTSTNTGWRPSIAIHPVTQRPYVSYHDVAGGALRLAGHGASGMGSCGTWGWNCVELDSYGRSGETSSLGFVPGGNGAYVVAYSEPDHAYIALRQVAADGVWNTSVIEDEKGSAEGDNEVVGFPSLVFREGKPRVAYYVSGRREYGDWNGIPDYRYSGSYYNGIDPSFSENFGPADVLTTGNEDEAIDYGYYPSLDIGANTTLPRMAYRGSTNQTLRFAEFNGTNTGTTCLGEGDAENPDWHCGTVDPASKTGFYISHKAPRKIGASYSPTQIAYYDANNGLLKYAKYIGGNVNCGAGGSAGWQCSVIDNVGTSSGPMGVAMALNSKGEPVIAYYDRNDTDHGVLKVAHYANSETGNCGPSGDLFKTWKCTTVDDGGSSGDDVGQWASIALDADDKAYVAYYNSSYQALMVAHEKSDTVPTLSASFTPSTIEQGKTTTVKYVLKNTLLHAPLGGLAFNHGLTYHTFVPGTLQTTCGNPQVSFVANNHAFKLLSATLAPNATCQITITVVGAAEGTWNTTTTALKSNEANDAAPAPAPLVVTGPATATPIPPTPAPGEPTATPTSEPVDPTVGPVDPTATPVEPTAGPVDPTATPTAPTAAPVDPTAQPVDPTVNPTTGSTGTIYRVYLPAVSR